MSSDTTESNDRRDPTDHPIEHPVFDHELLYHGRIWDLVSEQVDLGHTQVVREYVDHPGAVAIIALDQQERVLLLQQYRHPVRAHLWEPPAGLRDIPDEPPLAAAARELAEEADLRAGRWHLLTDFFSSPGGSNERIRVYLARDLSPVPDDERFTREDEEATMVPIWVQLDDAVDAVLTGRLQSPTATVGILAAVAARDRGWMTLREA